MWINRLLGSFRKKQLETRLNDELQFHLHMRTSPSRTVPLLFDQAPRFNEISADVVRKSGSRKRAVGLSGAFKSP